MRTSTFKDGGFPCPVDHAFFGPKRARVVPHRKMKDATKQTNIASIAKVKSPLYAIGLGIRSEKVASSTIVPVVRVVMCLTESTAILTSSNSWGSLLFSSSMREKANPFVHSLQVFRLDVDVPHRGSD